MIGSLRGELKLKQAPLAIVECAGVGYEVETPMSTFLELPAIGEVIFLHTHLVVRETAHSLFGFATPEEKALFRLLLGVSGVGAKMALGILSGISVDGFRRCVRTEDAATLVKVPGIGRKTAERLIMEMRDRLDKEQSGMPGEAPLRGQGSAGDEAYDALVALGYKPAEAARLIAAVDGDDIQGSEELIRRALKSMVNG